MTLLARLKGSSAKWYVLGIATAVAAGWMTRSSRPTTPMPDSVTPEPAILPPSAESIELVLTAQAREREGDSAGARSAYLEAAAQLPPISDYLRLRAAQLLSDSNGRKVLYRSVASSPSREQVRLTEARVLERMGELEGAAALRLELGQAGEAFRLRLRASANASARQTVLKDLVAWVADSAGSERGAVATAAVPFVRELRGAELLTLARVSPTASAPVFFQRASTVGARLSSSDHAAWGEALYARGSYRDAAARLRLVKSGPAEARSLLLRGRAMLRAGQSGGRAVLDELVRRFPADSLSTSTALFLLADLARDAGDYGTAGRRYSQVTERFPSSAEAPRARFMAGLIEYSRGNRAQAARTWDSLFLGSAGREESLSGGYWSGRALFELGDTAAARTRWRQVIARSRLSYYSRLAYRRLGMTDSTISAGTDQFDHSSRVERARQRLQLLSVTGLKTELGLEVNWLVSQAGNDLDNVVGTAALLRDHYRATYSAQLGWRALEGGAADSRTYRLIFPLLYEAPLLVSSLEERVDPALTAALIRQESLFDSMATSRAGARGLMQIMPAVGREMARSRRRTGWHADSLYQPRVNLEFGTSHLAWALQRYGGLERTLAAYNAGGSRVTRWNRFPGASDPEVFVEWIPFPETRTYVRTVLRNFEFYRGLYDWN
jgi:soluble lytic murein transglycosylase